MKIAVTLALILFCTPADAAKFSSSVGTARTFSAEKPIEERQAPPREATEMPDKDLLAVAPVSFDELRLFVRDWRKYSRWLNDGNNKFKAVAYLGVTPSVDYPPEVVRWMDEHGWATDRFFLLERKFRLTLSVLRQEEKRRNLVTHIQLQIANAQANTNLEKEEKDKIIRQFYRNIREVQDATQGRAPVTPDEYELIKLNKDAIEMILSE